MYIVQLHIMLSNLIGAFFVKKSKNTSEEKKVHKKHTQSKKDGSKRQFTPIFDILLHH